jgi:transposase
MARNGDNRKDKTSFCIVEAQSVKNTCTAENKGYEAGKKASGIKRHIAVDTNGLPHAIHVLAAEVANRNGAIGMCETHRKNLDLVEKVLCDGGYTGESFALGVKDILDAEVEIVKRTELHRFVVLPGRWVVERSFGWIGNRRRLRKNCERKLRYKPPNGCSGFWCIAIKEAASKGRLSPPR